MRILGVDPGSRFTGFGVIDDKQSGFHVVDYGVIRVKPLAFPYRLQQIFEELSEIIQTQKPDSFAIEQVFVAKNPGSALKLGHARGAAMLAGAVAGLYADEYSALQIKKAVVGQGRADKSQMQAMIKRLLNLPELPTSDAADALSVALCHGQSLRYERRQIQLGQAPKTRVLETEEADPVSPLRFRRGRLRRL